MRRSLMLGAALGLLLAAAPAPSSAQRSLSAIAGRGGGVTAQKTASGCWVCVQVGDWMRTCDAGVPGYWNCSGGGGSGCNVSSPGCGAGASIQVDPDGAVQFVSRSAASAGAATRRGANPTLRRNCEGVIVARYQAPAQIARVRSRTNALSL